MDEIKRTHVTEEVPLRLRVVDAKGAVLGDCATGLHGGEVDTEDVGFGMSIGEIQGPDAGASSDVQD